jgi:signal transduction histidine kinase
VVRTLAYVTTIGIFAAVYSVLVILLSTNLFSIDQLSSKQLLTLVLPALFIALTFHRLQLVIDRLTKRLFYRDAYDVRGVLDVLSNTLIEERDIDIMMQRSLAVLADALKPTSASLAVINESGIVYKQVSIGSDITPDLTVLIHRLGIENRDLIDSNEPNSQGMAHAMAANNTELLLRLGSKQAPVGVLILGAKRNGSMYSLRDVSVLEIAAKNMSIALDNGKKYEQIMHFAETLHKEVKHATYRLRSANKKLKSLDALKDDFIATASHQLRSPAVSVHDALQMLNYPGITEQDRKEMLEMAESSSERLVTVVRTMLDMARIQAGHFTIDRSEADIVELVNKELTQVGVIARQKHITLRYRPVSASIMAHVDIAKIKEAMANYIENAIKYSTEGATVEISLEVENNLIRFEVADHGMGVPEQERDKLFDRFYRASNARVEEPDGNGIGLYVVKIIAEGHEGQAYFRPNEGGGSVFGLTLLQS